MNYILLLLIGLIWGSQYILNAYVLESFSPLGLSAFRMFFGLLTLSLLIVLIPKERKNTIKMSPKLILLLVGLGATDAGIPFWLIAYGQSKLHSSIVAIMMGLIPIFTAVLQSFFGKKKHVSKGQIMGIMISLLGLFILINPTSEAFKGSIDAYLAILGACISFAIAFMFMDHLPKSISALRASRFVLFIYSLPFLAYWFFTEGIQHFPHNSSAWLAAVFLGAFSSGIVYIFYIKLVRLSGPTFTSFSNYLVPLIGTILGIGLLHEPSGMNLYIALVLITLGLFVSNKKQLH